MESGAGLMVIKTLSRLSKSVRKVRSRSRALLIGSLVFLGLLWIVFELIGAFQLELPPEFVFIMLHPS